MGVGIFSDCIFFLKVNSLSLKEKKKIKNSIILNGGEVSFVLNNKCTHAVVSNPDTLNSSQQKKIEKHLISVVNPDFIWKSVEEEQLGIQLERLDDNKTVEIRGDGDQEYKKNLFQERRQKLNIQETLESNLEDEMEFEDSDYDNIPDGTEVAKYCCFNKDKEFAIVELLCFSKQDPFPFRISTICGLPNTSQKEFIFHLVDTAEKACEKYELRINDIKNKGFTQISKVPLQAENLASRALKKVLLGEAINITDLSPEVAGLVESLWVDAVGHLDAILSCPVENISLNDLSKAEGILRQVRNALLKKDREDIYQMMQEFYRCIPHKEKRQDNINMKFLTVKQDLCQVIRDMTNVCETSLSRYAPTSAAKYQALKCRIEHLDPNSEEFHRVKQGILDHNYSNREFNILRIFRVGRMSEANNFKSDVGNVQPLLHASSPCNFVGILSRGLMMPKIIVDEFGGERTDIGNLGSGIYFSDSISTSVKYSQPSDVTGSRLLMICDVALGKCTDVFHRDYTITEAPNGFDSVHGVQRKEGVKSDFTDDEYVVYDVNQVQMRYVVQFSTDGDYVDLHKESLYISTDQTPGHSKNPPEQSEDVSVDNLPEQEVTKGGLKGSDGQPIPLESIHVKARLQDLAAQVVIFQTYKNNSSFPIEAKYVFPLDGTAAVCGFEAFINGKHIIGEVKEKQKAHQEYRTAISEGHGAYLMDQDAPDIFTVSVGNLPSRATVVIKITYVMELRYKYNNISFSIPGNVAEWQQDKALKENTQDTVAKVGIGSDMAPGGSFCLDMSIEMPRKIDCISSYTHEINIKRTECKAVIQTKEPSSFGDQGFIMIVSMENSYIPRMWVEKHPDQDSEACMLIFEPDIPYSYNDIFLTICLDCSNSMESCFQSAKQVALLAIRSLLTRYVNIVLFGSNFKELYTFPKPPQGDNSDMETFIKKAKPTMGSTEFWKVLQSLCLLTPKMGRQKVVLISDGHVQNENLVFQILSKHKNDIQLFTYGVGTTANKHMLRCFAQYGSGAFEYFADKSKSRWKDLMEKQSNRIDSSVCTAVSVKWRQFNKNPSEPLQAPANIQALFPDDSLFVYGFVPYCTQATLKALINNEELENMVSTTELQKTTGTMLHTLTARALVKDYEDGILLKKENENEMKKQEMKSSIIQLSIDYSIVTQFTSFVAVEKRSAEEDMDIEPNVFEIISAEDVDILPYMDWSSTYDTAEHSSSRSPFGSCQVDDDDDDDDDDYYDDHGDMGFGLFDGDIELKEASADLSSEDVYVGLSAFQPLEHEESNLNNDQILRPIPDESIDDDGVCWMENIMDDGLPLETSLDQMSDLLLAREQGVIADSGFLASSDLPINVLRRKARRKEMPESISALSVLEESRPQSALRSGMFGAAPGGGFGSAHRISAQLPFSLTSFQESTSAPLQTISLLQPKPPSVRAASLADTGFALKPSAQHLYQIVEPPLFSFQGSTSAPLQTISLLQPKPPSVQAASLADTGFALKPSAQHSYQFSMSPRAPEMSVGGQFASSPSLHSLSMKKSEDHLPQSYKLASEFYAPSTPSYMPTSPQAQPASRFGAVTGFSALNRLSLKSSAQPQSHTPAAPSYTSLMRHDFSMLMGAPAKSTFAFGAKSSSMDIAEQKESAQFLPQSLQAGLHASSHDTDDRGSTSLFGSAAGKPRLPSFEFGVPPPSPPSRASLRMSLMSASADPKQIPSFHIGGPPPPPPPVHRDGFRGFGGPPPPPPPEYRDGFSGFGGPPPPPPTISEATYMNFSTFLKTSKKKARKYMQSNENQRIQPAPPSWSSLSSLQSQEGFWLLNQELGTLLNINVSYFTADVLVKKGITSLGARGIDSIHKLIATLLVLQIIRAHNILSEIKFKTLMKLELSIPRSLLYPSIEKAIEWAIKLDRQYPGICMRLGLGKDWDQATRQLLGLDPITTTSDLYSVSEFLFLS